MIKINNKYYTAVTMPPEMFYTTTLAGGANNASLNPDDAAKQSADGTKANLLGAVIGAVVGALVVVVAGVLFILKWMSHSKEDVGGLSKGNTVFNGAYADADTSDYQIPNIPKRSNQARTAGGGPGGSAHSAIDRPGYSAAFGGQENNYDVPAEEDPAYADGQAVAAAAALAVELAPSRLFQKSDDGVGALSGKRPASYLEPGAGQQFEFGRRGTYLEPGQHISQASSSMMRPRAASYLEPGQQISGGRSVAIAEEDGPSYAEPQAMLAGIEDAMYADSFPNMDSTLLKGGTPGAVGAAAEYAYQEPSGLGAGEGEYQYMDSADMSKAGSIVDPLSGIYVTPASEGSLYAATLEVVGNEVNVATVEHAPRPLVRKASTYAGFGGNEEEDGPQAGALSRKVSTYAGFAGGDDSQATTANHGLGEGIVWEGDEDDSDDAEA